MADSQGCSEPLSKNEQKRRAKAEQKAKEKAQKEAERVAEAAKKEEAGGEPVKQPNKVSEEDISPNEYFKLRSTAIEEMKSGANHPYPHKFHVNVSLTEFIKTYSSMEDATMKEDGEHILCPVFCL